MKKLLRLREVYGGGVMGKGGRIEARCVLIELTARQLKSSNNNRAKERDLALQRYSSYYISLIISSNCRLKIRFFGWKSCVTSPITGKDVFTILARSGLKIIDPIIAIKTLFIDFSIVRAL